VEGVWLPKEEQHLVEWMTRGRKAHRHKGRITYQWGKQDAARRLAHEKGYLEGVMIDVGAHCGLWSMWWAAWVNRIIAYEPIELYREIYHANMREEGNTNYELIPFSLNDARGTLPFRVDPANTGGTRMYAPGEDQDAELHQTYALTLDDDAPPRLFPGERYTILKVDCEGLEEKVLRGGETLIRDHEPLIVVEQKFEEKWFGYERRGAVKFLNKLGYVTVSEIGGDFIMVKE